MAPAQDELQAVNVVKEQKQFGGRLVHDFKDFAHQYEIGNIIGDGTHGEVRVVHNKRTTKIRALRVINKRALEADETFKAQVETELMIKGSNKFDHTAIEKLKELYEDDKWYLLVSELLEGGELYT